MCLGDVVVALAAFGVVTEATPTTACVPTTTKSVTLPERKPCPKASCPRRDPDGIAAGQDLIEWTKEQVTAFFPYEEGWGTAYDKAFSPNVFATFNHTHFDFTTLKQAYSSFVPLLHTGFAGTFSHGFISAVGVPNAVDRGGFVTLTGWEGGFLRGDPERLYNVTDAAFIVVEEGDDCERKIIEFRETSNLGNF